MSNPRIAAGSPHFKVRYRRDGAKSTQTHRVATLEEAVEMVNNAAFGGPWKSPTGKLHHLEPCEYIEVSFVHGDGAAGEE